MPVQFPFTCNGELELELFYCFSLQNKTHYYGVRQYYASRKLILVLA